MINIQNKFYSLFFILECKEIESQNHFNLRFAEKGKRKIMKISLLRKRERLNHFHDFFLRLQKLCRRKRREELINRHHRPPDVPEKKPFYFLWFSFAAKKKDEECGLDWIYSLFHSSLSSNQVTKWTLWKEFNQGMLYVDFQVI